MVEKAAYWSVTALTLLAVILATSGIVLHGQNADLQNTIQQRAQRLAAGQQLANLFQGLVQNLAQDAVAKNDAAIRGLLEAEGIKLKPPEQKENKSEPAEKAPHKK